MTLKIRDDRRYCQAKSVMTNIVTGAVLGTTLIASSVKNAGVYQSIDSVYTGSFSPGRFRLNPVTLKRSSAVTTSGLMSGIYSGMRWTLTGEFMGFVSVSQPYGTWNSSLANWSKTKALAKVNSPELECGVMLGELGETLHMLRHPLGTLAKPLAKLRKARLSFLKKGQTVLDASANAWLQYRYGIIPLLRDLESIQKEFQLRARTQALVLRSKRAGHSHTDTTVTTVSSNGQVGGYGHNVEITKKTEILSTSVVYYQYLLNWEDRKSASYWGLNWSQLPSVAWELVPYSFVVDWFVNFGDWLRAVSPDLDLIKLGGCTSQKTVITEEHRMLPPYYIGSSSYKCDKVQESTYKWSSSTLIRQVDTLTSGIPTWNLDWFNFQRALNGTALLWQICSKYLR